jgi:hypothetical protein
MQQQAKHSPTSAIGSQDPADARLCRRWLRLLGGVAAILVFAFAVIPAIQRLPVVSEAHEAIRKWGIDATALFYTEADVSFEAEASIRDATRYAPARRPSAPEDAR